MSCQSDWIDPDSLISIEVTYVNPNPKDAVPEPALIISVQFNSLDIIANQETIIELISFGRRTFPEKMTSGSSSERGHKRKMPTLSQGCQTSSNQDEFIQQLHFHDTPDKMSSSFV